jgi:hypothetical protein
MGGQGPQHPAAAPIMPPHPTVTWHGTVRTEWLPASALDEFATASSRLSVPLGALTFFGGTALATLPSLGSTNPAAWVAYVFAAEVVATIIALIVWLARRPRLGRARAALGTNRIVRVEDYGPPPTSREGPPPVQDLAAQTTDRPRASINVLPTEREGPPPLIPGPGA